MGRDTPKGLVYFSKDCKFYSDIKIRKLLKRHGVQSISIYEYILCRCYEHSYYLPHDADLTFVIHEVLCLEEGYINTVIESLFEFNLFSIEMFKAHNIYTSTGIQKRYNDISIRSRRKHVVEEYSLLNDEDSTDTPHSEVLNVTNKTLNVTNKDENVTFKDDNVTNSTQSKVKESKEKKSIYMPENIANDRNAIDSDGERSVVLEKQYPPELIESFKKFNSWIDTNVPNIRKIKTQITIENFKTLKEGVPNMRQVTDKLTYIHNTPKYWKGNDRKESVYLTILAWLRSDDKK